MSTRALQLAPAFLPPYLHRARAHRCLQRWPQALHDLQAALALGTADSVRFRADIELEAGYVTAEQHHRETQELLPDYPKALGLTGSCTLQVVRRTYWGLAKKFHPDRFVGATEEERQAAVARFQAVSEAYRVLSDPELRAEWEMRSSVWTPPHMRLNVVG
uniref:J domain-containing protein n=2 Tax=Eutreptiella gymnastica TaxID=73025 RepID=A0A7S4G6X2_9EUGL